VKSEKGKRIGLPKAAGVQRDPKFYEVGKPSILQWRIATINDDASSKILINARMSKHTHTVMTLTRQIRDNIELDTCMSQIQHAGCPDTSKLPV
jgi:hypothetical protein